MPHMGETYSLQGNFKRVLVVEKLTVFNDLVMQGFASRTETLLLTARGFPDLATRAFLARLARDFKSIPLYCLVDADVYGVSIYGVYQMGSPATSLEKALVVPRLQLLGLFLDDLLALVTREGEENEGWEKSLTVLERFSSPMNADDMNKAEAMRRDDSGKWSKRVRKQIKRMCKLGRKVPHSYVSDYFLATIFLHTVLSQCSFSA